MRPVSDLFLQALAFGHTTYLRVDVQDPTGALLYRDLKVNDGTVTADRGSDCRYTCQIDVPDLTLMPTQPTDLLAPYGNRLAIHMGIRYPDGSVEEVPVGLFRIEQPQADSVIGPIQVDGKGLEAVIADDKLTAPRTITTGTDASVAVLGLLQDTMPGTVLAASTVPTPLPTKTYDAASDRWAAITECATAAGGEVFADAAGDWVMQPVPDISAASPVWEISAGSSGVLVTDVWTLSRNGVYNGVLATGENTSDNTAPVSALVVDTDATSPTYWSGSYGHSLYSFSSSLLTSVTLATAAAKAQLQALKAPNCQVELTAVPNPALEPGDCIQVVTADGRRDLHLIQSIQWSLSDQAMDIKTIARKDLGSGQ